MTFTQLKTQVKDYCGLSSTEADTRIGISINRHYRRVTVQCGINPIRFVTRSQATTTLTRTVVITNIEKIDRVIDATTATAIRPLDEVSIDEIRRTQSVDAPPTKWAFQSCDNNDITIVMDTAPTAVYTLQADGIITLSDLSGADVPAFAESYHDILAWAVIAEELLRKEKPQLAMAYEQKAERLLSELKFHLADSSRVARQGRRA